MAFIQFIFAEHNEVEGKTQESKQIKVPLRRQANVIDSRADQHRATENPRWIENLRESEISV